MDLLRNSQEIAVRVLARLAGNRALAGAVASQRAVLGAWAGPVRTTEDGIQVRGEEEVERPTARGIDGFAVVLEDGVQVGALLAVNQDGDEGLVEELGDGRVGERVLGCEVADWDMSASELRRQLGLGDTNSDRPGSRYA